MGRSVSGRRKTAVSENIWAKDQSDNVTLAVDRRAFNAFNELRFAGRFDLKLGRESYHLHRQHERNTQLNPRFLRVFAIVVINATLAIAIGCQPGQPAPVTPVSSGADEEAINQLVLDFLREGDSPQDLERKHNALAMLMILDQLHRLPEPQRTAAQKLKKLSEGAMNRKPD